MKVGVTQDCILPLWLPGGVTHRPARSRNAGKWPSRSKRGQSKSRFQVNLKVNFMILHHVLQADYVQHGSAVQVRWWSIT